MNAENASVPASANDLQAVPGAGCLGTEGLGRGSRLAVLHLGYEMCPEYELPLDVKGNSNGMYQLSNRLMQCGGTSREPDRSVLQVTPAVTLRGILDAAQDYMVNGRTPLEWAVVRPHIGQDKESGIMNDPNARFTENPSVLMSRTCPA